MQALNDYIILKEIPNEKKSLIITNEEESLYSKVISVGDKCNELKEGDTILSTRYAQPLDSEFKYCRESDILAKKP